MDGEGISERKVEIRVKKNGRKVIVEKSAAEGLPEGWIKKLVISNRSGRKSRRDPFFIDPKSEYIFQSFKGASRYVETGDLGNYARKLKESDIEDDDDSGNGKNVLLLESADDLLEKEKNRNTKRRNLSSSDEHTENCKMNSDLSIVASQVLEDLGIKEEAKGSIEKQPIAKRVTRSQAKASKNEEDYRDLKRKNPSSSNAKSRSASSQSPEKKTEKQITRSKVTVKKNELTNSVARRASKRLAGIELEPTPELKTRTTKAQRIVPPDDDGTPPGKCKQPVTPVVATSGLNKTDIITFSKDVAKSCSEHSSTKPSAVATSSSNRVSAEMEVQVEKIRKPVGRNGAGDKKMKTPLVITEEEPNPVFRLDGYKQKEKMSPVSPLLSRQASATKREKTAAGKRLGRSSPKANKVTAISPLRSSHPSSDNGDAIQRRNKPSNDSFQSSVVRGTYSGLMENNTNSFSSSAAFDSTLADLWKDPCIAFAIKTLTGESISSDPNNNHDAEQKGAAFFPETPAGSEKLGASSESPPCMDDIWKDPCIDFAIKTLTGAIPIGLDEPAVKPKSEGMTAITASSARQEEPEGRQSSSCDCLVQQCSNMKKKKKTTVGKSQDLRFPQSFSKN